MPVPFVGTGEAERLSRHRVLALLRDQGLLSEDRIALLLSWRHSGFSVHNTVRVAAGDTAGIERLGRYLLRSPVAVDRLKREPSTGDVLHQPKRAHERAQPCAQSFDPEELLARLLQHIPEPRLHQVRYYGRYPNAARPRRSTDDLEAHPTVCGFSPSFSSLSPSTRSSPTSSARQGLRPAARQRRGPSKFVPPPRELRPDAPEIPGQGFGKGPRGEPERALAMPFLDPLGPSLAAPLLSPQLQPPFEAPAEATPLPPLPLARVLPFFAGNEFTILYPWRRDAHPRLPPRARRHRQDPCPPRAPGKARTPRPTRDEHRASSCRRLVSPTNRRP